MKQQNILIIGAGGREHALAWKIAQSPRTAKLYVAPGNAGTALVATNVPISATDVPKLLDFAKTHDIGLTVVGPDDALAKGIVDIFQAAGLRIFGPTKAAARIESSKAFSKDLMREQKVPTAFYETFTIQANAVAYVKAQTFPIVVKASGLALGKGVYICQNFNEASRALQEIMGDRIFGESGSEVVIEDYLTGQEVSIHAFSDGRSSVLFPPSQDHKQIFDGDKGPNTGGMGSFAPVPWVKPELMKTVQSTVVSPILDGLSHAGAPFVGLLYPGLMVDGDNINVLEYNSRFGDPETQIYLRLLDTDLVSILDACVDGTLAQTDIQWGGGAAVCVVLASGGYPGKYRTGLPITGLSEAEALPGIVIFQAGTKSENGQTMTAGGRVLCVSAVGKDLAEAQARAYAAVKLIHFDGMQYRSDIASKALTSPSI